MCGFYDRPCRTKRGWTQEGIPHAKMLEWQQAMEELWWSKFNVDKKTQKAMPSVCALLKLMEWLSDNCGKGCGSAHVELWLSALHTLGGLMIRCVEALEAVRNVKSARPLMRHVSARMVAKRNVRHWRTAR